MSHQMFADAASKQLIAKLNELFDIIAKLSPEERQRLLDNPPDVGLELKKTDVSGWEDEIEAYLDSSEPLIEREEDVADFSEEESQHRLELQQAIFEKLGIAEEITELSDMRPQGKPQKGSGNAPDASSSL